MPEKSGAIELGPSVKPLIEAVMEKRIHLAEVLIAAYMKKTGLDLSELTVSERIDRDDGRSVLYVGKAQYLGDAPRSEFVEQLTRRAALLADEYASLTDLDPTEAALVEEHHGFQFTWHFVKRLDVSP